MTSEKEKERVDMLQIPELVFNTGKYGTLTWYPKPVA
jgi:hypothetical protein